MGIYLNPDGEAFEIAVQSDIYVDKTKMLAYLNSIISKEQRFVCVSRPRRFGKSMAANMQALDGYTGKILLVGVNYDKSTRLHSCEIDEQSK